MCGTRRKFNNGSQLRLVEFPPLYFRQMSVDSVGRHCLASATAVRGMGRWWLPLVEHAELH